MMMQMELGERLKTEGQDRAAGNNADWLAWARACALTHALTSGSVSTDDVQEWAQDCGNPPGCSNVYGAIFRGKHWRCVGRTKSRIPSNHAREIRVWEYVA